MLNLIRRVLLILFVSLLVVDTDVHCASNREIDSYLQTIAKKCLDAYFQVPTWERGIASESFILNVDGSVSQIKILIHPKQYRTKRTALNPDMALILAVKNVAPFPKPPIALNTPVKLILTFDLTEIGKPMKARVNISR